MKDWKIIAISATLAFLFSFISGLFGRVSLGVLLYRAILGAILFGAMGFGISLLLRRFLPEFFEFQFKSASEIDEDLSYKQQNHDIPAKGVQADKPVIDISIGDETEKPVDELSSENTSVEVNDYSNNIGNELVDEIVESVNNDEFDSTNEIPENIDVLPDMGVFSNSFENAEDANKNGSNNPGAVTLDIMGVEQDSELVAKALRTMVKKDQEG